MRNIGIALVLSTLMAPSTVGAAGAGVQLNASICVAPGNCIEEPITATANGRYAGTTLRGDIEISPNGHWIRGHDEVFDAEWQGERAGRCWRGSFNAPTFGPGTFRLCLP